MLNIEEYLQGIDGISSAIKQFNQGTPGGWQISNQLLGIAGGHSNRTTTIFYGNDEEGSYVNEVTTDLEIDRLASQLDIIASEAEVKAGLIMMISGGLLLGHWRKFKFSDNYKPKAYIDIWKAQYFYETGRYGQLAPDQIEPYTRRFNEFHRQLNKALQEVYGDLEVKVQQKFDELFTALASRCQLSQEDYETLNAHKLELLETTDYRRPYVGLLSKVINTGDNPKELWQLYLDIRSEINSLGKPEKYKLYDTFQFKRSSQRTYEPKFINHLKSSFGDDFEKIISKLNLEVA